MYAAAAGLAGGGPKLSIAITLIAGAIKAGVGVNEMRQKYGAYAAIALAAVLAHGPDKICQGIMPVIGNGESQ